MNPLLNAATAEVDVELVMVAARGRAAARFAGAANDNEAFRLQMLDDLNSDATKSWLVSNLIGVNELSCWFGEPGCSKSVIVADLALHVAAGKVWFERPVMQAPVVFSPGNARV